ncbi:MAG: hypothetical protein HQM12_20360 [SAR324 cluster bacterium]|nr:hypothetical protein [SAR324 cluster bacterium]
MKENQQHGVWIEVHGIQDYIFETPILKIMTGANSLMGEWLFYDLPELARSSDKGWELYKAEESFKALDSLDLEADDPYTKVKQGILNCLGGHFQALFTNKEGAEAFARSAQHQAHEKVPGIALDCFVFPVLENFKKTDDRLGHIKKGTDPEYPKIKFKAPAPLSITPWGTPCEWSGKGMATTFVKKKKVKVSNLTEIKYLQGDKFDDDILKTHDVLRLFEVELFEELREKFVFPRNLNPEEPGKEGSEDTLKVTSKSESDFKKLIEYSFRNTLPTGSLAVIAIDGNGYGDAMKTAQKNISPDTPYLQGAYELECFWYRARRLMRDSLKSAILGTVETLELHKLFKHLPFRILMLGGDDLLLVCAAEAAFEFLIQFDQAFSGQQKNSSFSFSAGAAVVPVKFPFHASQELAEQLLASAKIGFRQKKSQNKDYTQSFVDWHILTTGHTDSLTEIRQRDHQFHFLFPDQTRETLLLTPRPYPISDPDTQISLEKLWHLQDLQNQILEPQKQEQARRKLKEMRHSLKLGRYISQHHFNQFFDNSFLKDFSRELWPEKACVSLSQNPEHQVYTTWFYDFIELLELAHGLGILKQAYSPSTPKPSSPDSEDLFPKELS